MKLMECACETTWSQMLSNSWKSKFGLTSSCWCWRWWHWQREYKMRMMEADDLATDGKSDERVCIWVECYKPRPVWGIPLSLHTGSLAEWNLGLPSSVSRVIDRDPSLGCAFAQPHPAKSREMELAPQEACNTEDWPTHKTNVSRWDTNDHRNIFLASDSTNIQHEHTRLGFLLTLDCCGFVCAPQSILKKWIPSVDHKFLSLFGSQNELYA